MLLARNTAPDRLKAIGYVEQAITVLEEHGGDDVGDEVMTIWPLDQVTHSFVVLPPKRHTRWTSVIGFSRLPTTRGLNASTFVYWMTLGGGSRPAVDYVGMFRTARSEGRRSLRHTPIS
jgi:hypothetical protein